MLGNSIGYKQAGYLGTGGITQRDCIAKLYVRGIHARGEHHLRYTCSTKHMSRIVRTEERVQLLLTATIETGPRSTVVRQELVAVVVFIAQCRYTYLVCMCV